MSEEDTTQFDARHASLTNFLESHVDPILTTGFQSSLRSLIVNYGKAEFGRGYVQGAQDEK